MTSNEFLMTFGHYRRLVDRHIRRYKYISGDRQTVCVLHGYTSCDYEYIVIQPMNTTVVYVRQCVLLNLIMFNNGDTLECLVPLESPEFLDFSTFWIFKIGREITKWQANENLQ